MTIEGESRILLRLDILDGIIMRISNPLLEVGRLSLYPVRNLIRSLMSSLFNTRVFLLFGPLRRALAVLFTLLLTGCLPLDEPVRHVLTPQPQGKFEEGRYYDWKGMFSIKMNKCEQQYILEDFVPGCGTSTVAFNSLCDELRFVRVDNVSQILTPDQRGNPKHLVEHFRRSFHNVNWAGLLKCHQKAEVIHEEVLGLETGHPELFIIVSVPKASKSFFAYRLSWMVTIKWSCL